MERILNSSEFELNKQKYYSAYSIKYDKCVNINKG